MFQINVFFLPDAGPLTEAKCRTIQRILDPRVRQFMQSPGTIEYNWAQRKPEHQTATFQVRVICPAGMRDTVQARLERELSAAQKRLHRHFRGQTFEIFPY